MDRLNVSITGLETVQGGRYVPSIAEGIITIMLVAIGVAAFGLAVRFLPVMHHVEAPELVPAKAEKSPGMLAPVPVRS
jgi:Ni/Fe-hydrogenase subunit HybB-like protein